MAIAPSWSRVQVVTDIFLEKAAWRLLDLGEGDEGFEKERYWI